MHICYIVLVPSLLQFRTFHLCSDLINMCNNVSGVEHEGLESYPAAGHGGKAKDGESGAAVQQTLSSKPKVDMQMPTVVNAPFDCTYTLILRFAWAGSMYSTLIWFVLITCVNTV